MPRLPTRRGELRIFGLILYAVLAETAVASPDLGNHEPLSFAIIDYTRVWFEDGEAGDGTTLALAASKRLDDTYQPTFAGVWGHFGRADDELALSAFGGVDIGLRQYWYRGGVTAGIDFSHPWFSGGGRTSRHRRLYVLLGYEHNDAQFTLPGGISVDRNLNGVVSGVGALLQYNARNTLDLRVSRVNYGQEDEYASFTTYEIRNDYLWAAGLAVSVGWSYSSAETASATAVHLGLKWLFE